MHQEQEGAHYALMKIYADEGNQVSVQKQYRTLCQVLDEEVGMTPRAEITSWYNSWQKLNKQRIIPKNSL